MTAFDTILQNSAKAVGLNMYILKDMPTQNAKANINYKFPAIWRTLDEPTIPLFDNNQLREKKLSMYFVELGFKSNSTELILEHCETLLNKYETFKDLMHRSGIILTLDSDPKFNAETTNYNEFGLIFNTTASYSKCLTI